MTTLQALRNSVSRGFTRVLPAFWGHPSTKHTHYTDYGWPADLTFENFHHMYQRNGLAAAAVDKMAAKTWETHPALWESEEPTESQLESQIRQRFAKLRLWQMMMTVDRRSMVGCYAGAILLLADGRKLDEPVMRVPGGVDGLAGVIPAWEGQLEVVEWDSDPQSPTYGDPRYFQFNEAAVDDGKHKTAHRNIRIHPDRVLVWSEDGTVNGRSMLEPGFNDLMDAEKVKGAGGAGFWKTARAPMTLEAGSGDKAMSFDDFLKMTGTDNADDALDSVNRQVEDFQSGFDAAFLMAGITAKPLSIQLPQPEEFFNIPVQSFAASFNMPVRVLIGNQTGERASTEDAREWAQVNMGRRENIVLPMLHEFVDRLVRWGILPQRDWAIGWASLLDATPDQLLDRAYKMADINAKGEPAFMAEEIRETAGFSNDVVLPEQETDDERSEDGEVVE
jgi:hypothetical protein|tara:strand:+ start:20221 stop:21564 length:1344 start_codon:yes stop_codon:yes gene_type:complete